VRAQGPPRPRADRDPPRSRWRVGDTGRASGARRAAADARWTARVSCRYRPYELFSDTKVLGRMALERMLAGLSTRRYGVGLEPVGVRTEKAATATSKSAVSRRFVAQTETALAALLSADLSGLDLVAFMVDGVHFGEHCCVVAWAASSRDQQDLSKTLSLLQAMTTARRNPARAAGIEAIYTREIFAHPESPGVSGGLRV
jgi:hypothetical protein